MTATDLADYLVRQNMPFRQAHGVVGRIVAHCQARGVELEDLALAELRAFSELIEADVMAVLCCSNCHMISMGVARIIGGHTRVTSC